MMPIKEPTMTVAQLTKVAIMRPDSTRIDALEQSAAMRYAVLSFSALS
jgi:hypothetical protein